MVICNLMQQPNAKKCKDRIQSLFLCCAPTSVNAKEMQRNILPMTTGG